MARFGVDQSEIGRLEVRVDADAGVADAVFVPRQQSGPKAATAYPTLLRLEPMRSRLLIYPTNTLEGLFNHLEPKYDQIRTIVLPADDDSDLDDVDFEAILETLPPGFVKDYAYGLGLLKDCRRLVSLIEKHTDCTTLVLVDDGDEGGVDGDEFRLRLSDFHMIWSEISRINGRSNRAAARVKDAFVHNHLARLLGLDPIEANLGRHPVSKLITAAASGVESLTPSEQDELLNAVVAASSAVAQSHPDKLVKLQRDIEVVNLDRLIDHLNSSLDALHNEAYWQAFFDENSFALQQLFGVPMISVQSQATVSGTSLAGVGNKIADVLLKHSITNNLALVEIKTPRTKLLGAKAYRGGVYGPSPELTGAVTQVLDQAHQLTTHLPQLKHDSRRSDIEAYAVACFVIAGRTPGADDPAKQKSFEMYRANSRNVVIVTYDEILELLRSLRRFLAIDGDGVGDEANPRLGE